MQFGKKERTQKVSEYEERRIWTTKSKYKQQTRVCFSFQPSKASLNSLVIVVFELVWLDMFHSKRENLFHVSRNPKSFVQRALSKYGEEIPQLFVINILLPGSPEISITQYFALRKEVAEEMDRNPNEAMKLWKRFLEGDDAFRNNRFKMIPEIQEGPWLVKKSVGGNPSLIAKALQVSWLRGTKYLEAVVDVSSDRIAKHITSLCRRHATSLVVDIGFVIEGTDEFELPESLLACVRYNRPNCEDALPLE